MSYVSCSTSTKDSLGGWMVVSTKCLNVTTWCSNESWFDYVTAWCIVVIKDPHFTLVRRWISSNSAAWLYSSVYPSILKDFEDGLFVLYTQILWAPALASVYVLIFFFFCKKELVVHIVILKWLHSKFILLPLESSRDPEGYSLWWTMQYGEAPPGRGTFIKLQVCKRRRADSYNGCKWNEMYYY